ncbi:hypothetical protein BY458DRAFT_506777 [Sporodiniella umbellata]|nr:hypothetical protein BY458DRAFT_506777 [Sporodiniella umbellata]
MSIKTDKPIPNEIQLKDFISGQTISLNEWIQQELFRIQHNIEPRHCKTYSQLVQVIEEPFQFQAQKVPMISNSSAGHNTLTHFFSSCATQLHKLENIRRSLVADPTKRPTSTNLCHAFLHLFQSCTNTHSPRHLLTELDKIRVAMKQKKEISPSVFRVKLMDILFGKIQLTKQLIRPWQLVCQWMAMTDNNSLWIQLSTGIFVVAKKLYLKKMALNIKHRV